VVRSCDIVVVDRSCRSIIRKF